MVVVAMGISDESKVKSRNLFSFGSLSSKCA